MSEYSKQERSALWKAIAISLLVAMVVICGIAFAPGIRGAINSWKHDIQEADDATSYETRKKVEDTLRAYIASYEADKVTYETLKNETDEVSIETARSAKIRANRTAATYNSYYLENNYVWKDNVPPDIKHELPILE